MKTYLEFLKQNEPLDDYILFLLNAKIPMRDAQNRMIRDENGNLQVRQFTMSEVAFMCGVRRMTVYNAIARHYGVFQHYINNPNVVLEQIKAVQDAEKENN